MAILPDEVVYHIFSYLDPLSLSRASQCSTAFYRIATSPALWELPYLLRWSMGDEQREIERGTSEWRRYRKLQRLTLHARRAAAETALPSATTSGSPFRYFKLGKSAAASYPPRFRLDFYRLFLERIRIDHQVLDTLYQLVEISVGHISAVNSMARRFGSDAKDVLHAVIETQSSCPSWSSNGIPKNTESTGLSGSDRRKDALAYGSESYRVSAYQAHLPSTLRSDTHHLSINFHAREILEHLQRREAMDKLNKLSQAMRDPTSVFKALDGSTDSPCISLAKQTETAISLLSHFRGGETTYVEDQLDILAAACDLCIQQRPPQAIDPTADESPALARAKQMALAICNFLANHGFRRAQDDKFHDLDNNFLHKCFTTNRETLPLSLTIIFCGIANRLGMAASLCNFPGCIIAVVMADPSAPMPAPTETLSSAPQEMFWVLVSDCLTQADEEHEPNPTDAIARNAARLQDRPCILDRVSLARIIRRSGFPPSVDCWRPTQPDSLIMRAANNILQSVQQEQAALRDHAAIQARSVERHMDIQHKARVLEVQWSNLRRADHAFLSSYHGRTDVVEQEKIAMRVAAAWDAGATRGATCLDEDETTWIVLRGWRALSMHTLAVRPAEQIMPALPFPKLFRRYLEARATDNDWTNTVLNLRRRAIGQTDFDKMAAKYAAVNVFLRFGGRSLARHGDLVASFAQKNFPLDVEVVETHLLGIVHGDVAEGTEMSEDAASEGSDSSNEASFSSRGVPEGAPPPGRGALGMDFTPSSRIAIARMLHAARIQDREAPRVHRRSGASAENAPAIGQTNLVVFRVGTIFRHRTYGYTGHIFGWDPHCAASEDWIHHMGVDNLPAPSEPAVHDTAASSPTTRRGGRLQPFYSSYTYNDAGTPRYVAEVNVEPISGPVWMYGTPRNEARQRFDKMETEEEIRVLKASILEAMQDRKVGLMFRCFDQVRGRFRRSAYAREVFPDDLSDEEEEEEDDQLGTLEESVENLSEDGHW